MTKHCRVDYEKLKKKSCQQENRDAERPKNRRAELFLTQKIVAASQHGEACTKIRVWRRWFTKREKRETFFFLEAIKASFPLKESELRLPGNCVHHGKK